MIYSEKIQFVLFEDKWECIEYQYFWKDWLNNSNCQRKKRMWVFSTTKNDINNNRIFNYWKMKLKLKEFNIWNIIQLLIKKKIFLKYFFEINEILFLKKL